MAGKLTPEMIAELRRLHEVVAEHTCGDVSCRFSRPRGGQATNGGCRCFDHGVVRVPMMAIYRKLPALLDRLDALELEHAAAKALQEHREQPDGGSGVCQWCHVVRCSEPHHEHDDEGAPHDEIHDCPAAVKLRAEWAAAHAKAEEAAE